MGGARAQVGGSAAKWVVAWSLVLSVADGTNARAAPPSAVEGVSRAEVQAATDAAVRGLKAQVDRLPLGPKLTVGEFLGSIRGADQFMLATLQRAQLVGGVRSLDANTAQVRLDITGRVVADALMQIAGAYQKQTPHSPRFIAESTRAWSDQTFTATGLSTGAVLGSSAYDPRLVRRSVPNTGPASTGGTGIVVTGGVVAPEAVEAAKRSAAGVLLTAISTVELPGGGSTRDLVRLPVVRDAVTAHVLARPMREVERRDNGEVRVVVTLEGGAVAEVVRSSAIASRDPGVPVEEATWSRWREAIASAVPGEVEGVFRLPATGAGRERVVFAADQPPAWVSETVEAEASASDGGSKLMTARAAESNAARVLSVRVGRLMLAEGLSLAEAARREPRYAEVVERAVARARVFRVEYFEDGSVTVQMTTDPRLIWRDVLAVRSVVESLGG